MSLKTPLEAKLSPSQKEWLTSYVCARFDSHYSALSEWREKMKVYKARLNDDYRDRCSKSRAGDAEGIAVFADQNESLGLTSGFADFAFAQAKDDLFGAFPFFTARPQGKNDAELAQAITRHAHWKLGQTSVTSVFADALNLVPHLGTAFVKASWRKEEEVYERRRHILVDKDSREPLLRPDGDYVYGDENPLEVPTEEEHGLARAARAFAKSFAPRRKALRVKGVPEMRVPDDGSVEWEERDIEEKVVIYHNVEAKLVDSGDIAFNPLAPELDLLHTDVYERFRIGLLDAKRMFDLSDEDAEQLLQMAGDLPDVEGAHAPVHELGERAVAFTPGEGAMEQSNPLVPLVEGYLRCDPFGTGTPSRIYVVFSPLLRLVVKADFLQNVTPRGMVPFFPVRWFRTPNRILGRGYHERFEAQNDFIDGQFSAVTFRDRLSANPVGGYNADAVEDDLEDESFTLHPRKLYKLKPERTIDDFLQFKTMPDVNNRAVDLLQMQIQMLQLRTGISSAAQGELKGLPDSNTATGVRQIISRGATLLKWPIDDAKADLERALSYVIHLIYANQDTNETFTWGEGTNSKLVELNAEKVRNLPMDVTFSLSQAQEQEVIENTKVALELIANYLATPEIEKAAVRPLYLQAMDALGYRGGDEILRTPVATLEDALPLLPQEEAEKLQGGMSSDGRSGPAGTDATIVPAEA